MKKLLLSVPLSTIGVLVPAHALADTAAASEGRQRQMPVAAASPNPDLAASCGIDVALLLDASGSIKNANATGVVASAAQTFVASLMNTDSRLAIISFDSRASVTGDYLPVTEASVSPGGEHWRATNDHYQMMSADEAEVRTNWDGALEAVAALRAPKLVVLITDGAPTAWLDDAGLPVDAPDTNAGVENAALEAQHAADVLRTSGSHLLAISVGSLSAAVNPANYRNDPPRALTLLTDLVEPSADDLGFYLPGADGEANTLEVASDDVVVVQDFGLLGAQLRELATSLCPPPERERQTLPKCGPGETLAIGLVGGASTFAGMALRCLARRKTNDIATAF